MAVRDLLRLPKAELHVHLESTVRESTLAEIGLANGVELPVRQGPRDHGFVGFADFFEHNALVRACLRTAADFRRIAVDFCEDAASQGTRYAEVSFTAAAHGERVGDPEMPLMAVLDGLTEGRSRFGLATQVLLDHSRRRPVARAWSTVELAVKYADQGVVGVGLAGDEAFPVGPFAEVFAAARQQGLRVVHHAGEALGPDSIRQALEVAGAERIGHGITALGDDALVDELRERRIPLEVCPSSNLALGFVRSLEEHPLPRMVEAGLVVTLNTDIPAMIHTPLAVEYAKVRDTFGYTDVNMAAFATTGIDASFAPESLKKTLRRDIETWLEESTA